MTVQAVEIATSIKVFALCRSGSGKSTGIHHFGMLAKRRGYEVFHVKDYTILRSMFLQDFDQKRFRPAECNGFDVTDFSVLDEALIALEKQVHDLERNSKNLASPKIVFIEFARNDYYHALKLFTPKFLEDAYFLFIDSELETCIERIHKRRIQAPSEQDSHSVSDFIMRSYFHTDNWYDTIQKFSLEGHVLRHWEITNNGSLETFLDRVSSFAETIFHRNVSKNQQQNGIVASKSSYNYQLLEATSANTSPIMEPVLD